MAKKEYPKLTQAQGLKAAAWAQVELGLQSWNIRLSVRDDRPEALANIKPSLGATIPRLDLRRADMWVSPANCEADGSPALETLFHECVHLALMDTGLSEPPESQEDESPLEEFFCDHIAAIMVMAYRK